MTKHVTEQIYLNREFPFAVHNILRDQLSQPEVVGRIWAQQLMAAPDEKSEIIKHQAKEVAESAVLEALGPLMERVEFSIFLRNASRYLGEALAAGGEDAMRRGYRVVISLESGESE